MDEPPTTATHNNNYLTPGSGNYESVAIYNDKLYAVKGAVNTAAQVYEWEPTDASASPTLVLTSTATYFFAAGLTFDEKGNMYVGDFGNGGDIYKYEPLGATWGNESLFVDNVGAGVVWLQHAVPEPSSLLLIVPAAIALARRRIRS